MDVLTTRKASRVPPERTFDPPRVFTMQDARRTLRQRAAAAAAAALSDGSGPPSITSNQIRYLHTILPQGAWSGQRCFIVGGGPSARDFDFSLLRNELVIGINRAFEVCDPTILYAMDERLWGWIETGQLGEECRARFRSFRGIRCWVVFNRNPSVPVDEAFFVRNVPGVPLSSNLADGVHSGTHSGYGALNLAILLGANPIYLIGYDMDKSKEKQKVWWHSGYPSDGQTSAVYDLFRGEFRENESTFRDLSAAGTRIVNLNPHSSLTLFDRVSASASSIHPIRRPLVVSFYTPPYAALAARMRQSIARFGFETDVVGIESRGDWLANVHYKTDFMLAKLLEHKRDILWLDADSVVNRYPALFCDFPGDIGVHYINWAQHTHGRNSLRELDDAVFYAAYNERTIKLMGEWVSFNQLNRRRAEQLNLQVMLDRVPHAGLNLVELPAEYCTIFDTMADVPDPIIEQFQASRQLRRAQ